MKANLHAAPFVVRYTSICSDWRLRQILMLAYLLALIGPAFAQTARSDDALDACWQDLASKDSEVAFRAMSRLVQNADSALDVLRALLKPATKPDLVTIQAWVNDLGNPVFAVRDKAFQALVKQGELAELPLRQALQKNLDVETRRRMEGILAKLDLALDAPEKLKQLRAVEVLEMLPGDGPAALLQRLADGYAENRQTLHAKESLTRRKNRVHVPDHWLAFKPADNEAPLPFGARARLGTTRFRHETNGERAVSFTADCHHLISHDEEAVYVWERQTGRLQKRFEFMVACLAASPKDSLLVVGVADRLQKFSTVVYLDWQTGKEHFRRPLPDGVYPVQLTFSPDGDKVFCKGSDEKLRMWLARPGPETIVWQPDGALQKLHGFSPDGHFAVLGARGANYVFDFKKNQKLVLPKMDREPRQMAFSPDGALVAISCDDSTENLLICDTATGNLVWRNTGGIGPLVYSLRFLPGGKIIAAASYRKDILLWDVQTGKFLRNLPESQDRSIGAISADGRWLAGIGKTMHIWNLETGERVATGLGHDIPINGLAFSPHYDWIATNDYKQVQLWDARTGNRMRNIETGGTFIRGAALSPDGKFVAAANPGLEGFVKVWETATGRLHFHLPDHGVRNFGRSTDVHFSPDGRYLVSWGDDFYLRKWDMKTGRALVEHSTRLPGLERNDRFEFALQIHIGWNAERDRFYLLHPNGDLHRFDVDTGNQGPVIKLRSPDFGPCVFSNSAKLIAISSRRNELMVSTTDSNRFSFTTTLTGTPLALAFSPDERTLAVAARGKITLIEMITGQERLSFPAKAQALTFSPDGRFLGAGMSDTSALVWDLAMLATPPKN